MRRIFPTFARDPDFEDWYVTHERLAASPAAGVAFLRMLIETDIRDVLPAIRVPTLLRAVGRIYEPARLIVAKTLFGAGELGHVAGVEQPAGRLTLLASLSRDTSN